MKNWKKAIKATSIVTLAAVLLIGCGKSGPTNEVSDAPSDIVDESISSETPTPAETQETATQLSVAFGSDGKRFTMNLEDNPTAAAIARAVGTSSWQLPIYERDDNADYSVMQYYDIPSRYDIPSNPENITSEKAGEVYYSNPSRIILFYHDAEIPGEYTKIGNFDATEEFIKAVEENPVLEGWGNKLVLIETVK